MSQIPTFIGIMPREISSKVNTDIIEEHIDQASNLYLQWTYAIQRPDYTYEKITELKARLDANLVGMCIGNEASWQYCHEMIGEGEEYIFPAVILAFKNDNIEWKKAVLKAVTSDNAEAFIHALYWLNFNVVKPFLAQLVRDKRPFYQYIAVSTYRLLRQQLSEVDLKHLLSTNIPLLKTSVIRLLGELKCYLYSKDLFSYLSHQNSEYRFWAARSLAIMGYRSEVIPVLTYFIDDHNYRRKALQILLRICGQDKQYAFINSLIKKSLFKEAILGIGIVGDTKYVPWLIDMMKQPELARLAGESFCSITGIELEFSELTVDDDPDYQADKDDDDEEEEEEEEEELDEYEEDLQVPSPQLVDAWWNKFSSHFTTGIRYLSGQPINADSLLDILQTGLQRQRIAAALELALLDSSHSYLFIA
ncbi:TIGR02270 family protein [Pragia fontium]|uniref:TIGR02270 family protein n=1 Tax=Pragia fontium TaxID=82985 RepID=UPI000F713AD2|nr:TIGR02270 family protein [Pragia fontium]VEJ56336.1 Uncharacterised protein [Pragia fontium]